VVVQPCVQMSARAVTDMRKIFLILIFLSLFLNRWYVKKSATALQKLHDYDDRYDFNHNDYSWKELFHKGTPFVVPKV